MRDWREPNDYAYTAALDKGRWAWEFLRRNPDYRQDWSWFWPTWQALEADYGKPPERDYWRWKQDPRAYIVEPLGSADGDACRVDEDKVLIECWMGAKWGFYKFPLDPARSADTAGNELTWRELATDAMPLDSEDKDYLGADPTKLALGFDLSLPLKPQFEAARRYVAIMQRTLARRGLPAPRQVKDAAPLWRCCLRLLDGEAAGAGPRELADVLFADRERGAERDAAYEACRREAQRLVDGGYRDILRLPDRERG